MDSLTCVKVITPFSGSHEENLSILSIENKTKEKNYNLQPERRMCVSITYTPSRKPWIGHSSIPMTQKTMNDCRIKSLG